MFKSFAKSVGRTVGRTVSPSEEIKTLIEGLDFSAAGTTIKEKQTKLENIYDNEMTMVIDGEKPPEFVQVSKFFLDGIKLLDSLEKIKYDCDNAKPKIIDNGTIQVQINEFNEVYSNIRIEDISTDLQRVARILTKRDELITRINIRIMHYNKECGKKSSPLTAVKMTKKGGRRKSTIRRKSRGRKTRRH